MRQAGRHPPPIGGIGAKQGSGEWGVGSGRPPGQGIACLLLLPPKKIKANRKAESIFLMVERAAARGLSEPKFGILRGTMKRTGKGTYTPVNFRIRRRLQVRIHSGIGDVRNGEIRHRGIARDSGSPSGPGRCLRPQAGMRSAVPDLAQVCGPFRPQDNGA